jgi:hypothetical protein
MEPPKPWDQTKVGADWKGILTLNTPEEAEELGQLILRVIPRSVEVKWQYTIVLLLHLNCSRAYMMRCAIFEQCGAFAKKNHRISHFIELFCNFCCERCANTTSDRCIFTTSALDLSFVQIFYHPTNSPIAKEFVSDLNQMIAYYRKFLEIRNLAEQERSRGKKIIQGMTLSEEPVISSEFCRHGSRRCEAV